MSRLLPNLVRFGRLLHDLGLDIQAGRMLDVARALPLIDIGRRQDFYYTLRTLLIHRADDLALFDQAFRAFWRPPRGERTRRDLRALGEQRRYGRPRVEQESLRADAESPEAASAPAPSPEKVELRTYSGRESLRQKDFGKLTAEELEQARALLAQFRWEPGFRRTLRWRGGGGRRPDLRQIVRDASRGAPETLALPGRERRRKPRPIVLLCDVSGSMERYSRMLLQLMVSITEGFQRVEAFVFATRLTRITLPLRAARRARAASPFAGRLAALAPDWSGGTRIGEALRAFHLHWARRVSSRGPVVLLISDGWDRGDPAALSREMARLQRGCHRLIWLNPLLGSPEYQPLTRGMQAALPFVDDFLPVHNLASLEDLAQRLNSLPDRRRSRRARTP
ncbi:MAG: VWA domain-containing protein [Acidobacteria bacterium]|nr:VWA domain-containing protein [Acidobacteriota bacterium]